MRPLALVAALALGAAAGAAGARPPEEALRSRQDFVLFGPLGEDSYLRYSPIPPNDPRYAVNKIRSVFGRRDDDANAVPRGDRQKMWELYQGLLDRLEVPSEAPLLEDVYAYDRSVSTLATEQLTANPTGLGLHLSGIRAFCNAFYCTPEGHSRFPKILTDRQALVMAELVGPLHDTSKFLGSFKAQVMPDHEVMTAELARRTFLGHTVLIRGQKTKLTAEDVDLVSSVIGDHENIEKEAGRTDWLHSSDVRQRAKALFFIADVLTGALGETSPGSGKFQFVPAQLDARFVDLYFRHIDLVKGKIFRPEWGLLAMRDLGTTLHTLAAEHGLQLAGDPQETMRAAALAGLQRALDAETERWRVAKEQGKPHPDQFFTEEQKERLAKVKAQLGGR